MPDGGRMMAVDDEIQITILMRAAAITWRRMPCRRAVELVSTLPTVGTLTWGSCTVKRVLATCSTAVALLCIGATRAEAATYYTALTGNDANSCAHAQSISTPKRTVTAGVSCLQPGDTLYVRAGDIHESRSSTMFRRELHGVLPYASRRIPTKLSG